ncbi:MAG TPA: heavy-metal-associated domain-containing protein [Ferruginibacter sp.]|nr:heavy-metal-associated domain-containing protein [Ferruginibacter sp.]
MKQTLTVLFILVSCFANAQVTHVNLQASGLTCSLCSNAINKALQKLDYVNKVEPNVQQSSFDITFKEGANVDFDQLKKKVEDAGFSVAKLTAVMHFDHVKVVNDEHVTVGNTVFHFLHVNDQELDGDKTIRVLDKGFVTAKEFKKNSIYTSMECYKTGVAGACCAKANLPAGKRIYHVTI